MRVNLVLNRQPIDTIDEIAANYVEADMLDAFRSGLLKEWLSDQCQDDMANAIGKLKEGKNLANNIIVVLGLDKDECMESQRRIKEERQEVLTKKAKAIRKKENDSIKEQVDLANKYFMGDGVEQNYSMVIKLLQKPVELGNADALNLLGGCYLEGKGVEQNYTKALELQKRAALQGHIEAQECLGALYLEGKGVQRNYSMAMKCFQEAAKGGCAEAQYYMGLLYYAGKGVKQNYDEAVKWLRKAAQRGVVESQTILGLCYKAGSGVAQNYKEAVKWFRKAADQGESDAQYYLGVCFWEGTGVVQNHDKAIELFQTAAEQGNTDAKDALVNLNAKDGETIANGESIESLKMRADADDFDAKNQLVDYYDRLGNYMEAAKWCRMVADAYESGIGVKRSHKKAMKWYRRAAGDDEYYEEYADAETMNMLGMFYDEGKGVEQDKKEAMKWFKKAAAYKNPIGAYNVGMCYWENEGLDYEGDDADCYDDEMRLKKARTFFGRADSWGYADARQMLSEVKAALKKLNT